MEQSLFWEDNKSFSQTNNFLSFTEPKGSLPCSQGPKSLCPEPDAFSPHLPPYFCNIHSNIILPPIISHLSHASCMPCPSHPQFDHPNNIWWSVQVTVLILPICGFCCIHKVLIVFYILKTDSNGSELKNLRKGMSRCSLRNNMLQ